MHIVVPIKQVPETSEVKMDEESGTMIRAGVESIINPLDLYAIEQALMLKEQSGGIVTVLSMGPKSAVEAIREAVAMGCDRGYLVSDRKFAGADTWATSYVLANAIRYMDFVDLVICGERATDGDTGQVGPGIASFLDLPVLTYVAGLEVDADSVVVRRLVENGYEVYRALLPLVLTVVKEIAYPRLPTLRGKQRARRMEIPVWDNATLGLDEQYLGLKGSPTRVKRIFRPKVSREGEILVVRSEDDLEAATDRVVAYLDEKNLL
ncbi:MAG: electron transfer flavoprotein subunit beta/FixA family protein [Anaerolineae bacterium]|nr:electron transfer flavoprotein subunit beta/FixA family protein [Anaerolineae bacterium]